MLKLVNSFKPPYKMITMENKSSNWLDNFYQILVEANLVLPPADEHPLTKKGTDQGIYNALQIVKRYNTNTKAYLKRINQQKVEQILNDRIRFHRGNINAVLEEITKYSNQNELVPLYRKFVDANQNDEKQTIYDKCLLLLLDRLERGSDFHPIE